MFLARLLAWFAFFIIFYFVFPGFDHQYVWWKIYLVFPIMIVIFVNVMEELRIYPPTTKGS